MGHRCFHRLKLFLLKHISSCRMKRQGCGSSCEWMRKTKNGKKNVNPLIRFRCCVHGRQRVSEKYWEENCFSFSPTSSITGLLFVRGFAAFQKKIVDETTAPMTKFHCINNKKLGQRDKTEHRRGNLNAEVLLILLCYGNKKLLKNINLKKTTASPFEKKVKNECTEKNNKFNF